MPKVTELEAGTFSIPDVIEPSSADFTNKDYVSMDGIEGFISCRYAIYMDKTELKYTIKRK